MGKPFLRVLTVRTGGEVTSCILWSVTLGDVTKVPAAKPESKTDAESPSKTDGANYAGAFSSELFELEPKVKYGEVV